MHDVVSYFVLCFEKNFHFCILLCQILKNRFKESNVEISFFFLERGKKVDSFHLRDRANPSLNSSTFMITFILRYI